jgi:hypothetical protein
LASGDHFYINFYINIFMSLMNAFILSFSGTDTATASGPKHASKADGGRPEDSRSSVAAGSRRRMTVGTPTATDEPVPAIKKAKHPAAGGPKAASEASTSKKPEGKLKL